MTDLAPGRIRYSLVTNEQGGILDDVLVGHFQTPSDRLYYLLVVNACNRAKIVAWIQHASGRTAGDVEFSDRTEETAMIAVQGPRAVEIVAPLVKADVRPLGYYTGVVTEQLGRVCIVSRTGYTGEDGFELIVRAADAVDVWQNVFLAGRGPGRDGGRAGARDTLRLEAGMPLYGHELSEQINPSRPAWVRRQPAGPRVRGLRRRWPIRRRCRPAAGGSAWNWPAGAWRASTVPCWPAANVVGQVTSGTFSPTFDKPIAMAYVRPEAAAVGTELQVDIRGRCEPAQVVKLPFYKRSSG